MRTQAVLLAKVLACCLWLGQMSGEQDIIASAVDALQEGDAPRAERILRDYLSAEPKDGAALGVLGVVLDQEKKYKEADEIYRRALRNSPENASLLNNYGNHLIATGKSAEARKAFLQVIALDARNVNALVQLARVALEQKNATEALEYLDRIPIETRGRRDADTLRMQADYKLGREHEADALLAAISRGNGSDPGQSFALGVALSSVGQYEKAETLFSKAVEASPGDFEALYDLGLAAAHARHNERARRVLDEAHAQRPENVDVLYDLAAVNVALNDKESALALLAKAAQLAPHRAGVLELEARTAGALGYFADATHSWDQYLKLEPGDESARRERAFVQTAMGENMSEGMAELNAFVRKHPKDAAGYYELGTAETPSRPGDALKQLDRALEIDGHLTAAHVARGLLLYRQGDAQDALAEFKVVSQAEPNNGIILDRLGEIYLTLDRIQDALPVLRKAAELLPNNATVLLHLGRALSKAGQAQEAASVFARCRELGPSHLETPHPLGLVEFMGLSESEQRARYRSGVERIVKANPENAEAQVRYLGILLEEGKTDDAAAVVGTLLRLDLSPSLLREAAGGLFESGQYSLAKQLLDKKLDAPGAIPSGELALDRAVADAHVMGGEAGLEALGHTPMAQRNGEYYLARAQMLQAQNRPQEAEECVREAIRKSPTESLLYRQAGLILIEDKQLREAKELIAEGTRKFPNDPELLLMQALVFELTQDQAKADTTFKQLEDRWPEWSKVWIAQALVFDSRQQPQEAQKMREAAAALGADGAALVRGGSGSGLADGITKLLGETQGH